MPVKFMLRKQEYELEGTIRVKEALKELGLSLEAYFVVKDGELLNENDVLRNGDVVKIVSVISGG